MFGLLVLFCMLGLNKSVAQSLENLTSLVQDNKRSLERIERTQLETHKKLNRILGEGDNRLKAKNLVTAHITDLSPEERLKRVTNEVNYLSESFLDHFKFHNSSEEKIYKESVDQRFDDFISAVNYGNKDMAEEIIRCEIVTNVGIEDMDNVLKRHLNQLVRTYDSYNPQAPLSKIFVAGLQELLAQRN